MAIAQLTQDRCPKCLLADQQSQGQEDPPGKCLNCCGQTSGVSSNVCPQCAQADQLNRCTICFAPIVRSNGINLDWYAVLDFEKIAADEAIEEAQEGVKTLGTEVKVGIFQQLVSAGGQLLYRKDAAPFADHMGHCQSWDFVVKIPLAAAEASATSTNQEELTESLTSISLEELTQQAAEILGDCWNFDREHTFDRDGFRYIPLIDELD